MQELTFEQVESVSGGFFILDNYDNLFNTDKDDNKNQSENISHEVLHSSCIGHSTLGTSVTTCFNSDKTTTVTTCVGLSSPIVVNYCTSVTTTAPRNNDDLEPVGKYWGV